jgi:serine protease Do
MTQKPTSLLERRKGLAARRLALLGSIAGLVIAVIIAGLSGYNQIGLQNWLSSAQAAVTLQLPRPASFADIVAKVKPAVISVRVKIDGSAKTTSLSKQDNNDANPFKPDFPFDNFLKTFGSGNRPDNGTLRHHKVITGAGSGFFISPDGYAVTNFHVVDHAKAIKVKCDDGAAYSGKVIGTDPKTDLALIKVDGRTNFPYVRFADHMPRVGDFVVAIGNPFGLGGTVTAGIVSARGRDIGAGPYDDFIQIDAPINKGNSGGPAFDMDGKVIGVNTAIYSPSGGSIGIGFDIPSEAAKLVVGQLKEHGFVTRGWIGVQVQPVTADIADSLGMKIAEGALVDEPQPNSPATKAGIHAGDVITAVNGTAVKDARDLARKIGVMAPGSPIKLNILHKGTTKTVTLALGQMPNERQARANGEHIGPATGAPYLGLTLAPANDVDGFSGKGVVISSIDPDGPAANHGLRTGDVILDVGSKAVAKVDDVRKALIEAKAEGKHHVLMRVKTADATKFVALPIGNG